MKTISLSQDFVALVDDADFDRVSAHKWSATKVKNTAYGVRKIRIAERRTTTQLLHRFIMNVSDPEIHVDQRRP